MVVGKPLQSTPGAGPFASRRKGGESRGNGVKGRFELKDRRRLRRKIFPENLFVISITETTEHTVIVNTKNHLSLNQVSSQS